MKRCTKLADSLVSGEPLTDAEREHLAGCADCTQMAAVTRALTAVGTAAEVGPGFTSRVIAGARERITARRRQRVAGFGLAAVVAAAAAALIVTSARREQPRDTATSALPAGDPPTLEAPDPASGEGITDDELRELVGGASMTRALAPSADWEDVETPVRNYRAVLRLGGQP